jgi:aldehyde dehydrogenase (NAD+)
LRSELLFGGRRSLDFPLTTYMQYIAVVSAGGEKMNRNEIQNIIEDQKTYFMSGKTRGVSFRKERLRELSSLIRKSDKRIVDALYEDMKKPAVEAYASEIAVVRNEIGHVLRNIDSWSKIARVNTPKHLFPSRSFIMPEPYGVCLIISPWNYPFNLALIPLVSSIAAGNCSIIKPSEYSPQTSILMNEVISGAFDPSFIKVVTGGVEEARALLEEKFDYIFFTGSVATGRRVMEAAARHLTPVTLELGGKSPCIIDRDVDIDVAARRIAWAKFFNSGQTCIAPDYLLVDRTIKGEFTTCLKKHLREFYGDDASLSPDYARIINNNHFKRLKNLMDEGDIILGGRTDEAGLYIEPTIIDNVRPDNKIMQEEIFGPILPIMAYDDLDEAISFVNSRPRPLSLYVFSHNQTVQDRVLNETSSGGVCINDAMVHFASDKLPFGGVGESGMGAYHGKAGFDTFTHYKGVVRNNLKFDLPFRYAPYRCKLPLVRWFF